MRKKYLLFLIIMILVQFLLFKYAYMKSDNLSLHFHLSFFISYVTYPLIILLFFILVVSHINKISLKNSISQILFNLGWLLLIIYYSSVFYMWFINGFPDKTIVLIIDNKEFVMFIVALCLSFNISQKKQ